MTKVISSYRASGLQLKTHGRRTIFRRSANINVNLRAEVNFVSAEEAKRLVTSEGYVIVDVRDKTQFERAHIRSCRHVPLFIENQDSDFGNICCCILIFLLPQLNS